MATVETLENLKQRMLNHIDNYDNSIVNQREHTYRYLLYELDCVLARRDRRWKSKDKYLRSLLTIYNPAD